MANQNIIEIILRARDMASKELKDTEGRLASLSATAMKTGGVLMGIGGAVAGSMLAMATKTAEAGHEFEIASNKVGISASALSQYAYILKLTDGSMEGFTRSLKILSGHMYDAKDAGSESAKIFKKLGISVTDSAGNLKGLDAMFMETSGALQKVGNDTERTALTAKLFGRGALELATFLKMPIAEVVRLREESIALGVAFTEADIKAASELADGLKTLHAGISGVTREIGKALIPTLAEYVKQSIDVVKGTVAWVSEHRTATLAVFKLAGAILGAGGLLVALGAIVKIAPLVTVAMSSWGGAIGIAAGALAALYLQMSVIPGIQEEIRKTTIAQADALKELPAAAKAAYEKGQKDIASLSAAEFELYRKTVELMAAQQKYNDVTEKTPELHALYAKDVINVRSALDGLIISQSVGAAGMTTGATATTAATDALAIYRDMLNEVANLETKRHSGRGKQFGEPAPLGEKVPEGEPVEQQPLVQLPIKASEQFQTAAMEIAGSMGSIYNATLSAAQNMTSAFSTFFSTTLFGAGDFASKLKSLFESLGQSILSAIGGELGKTVVGFLFGLIGLPFGLSGGGKVPLAGVVPMQTGGKISGGVAGRDSVPALLMPGEVVLNVGTVKKLEQLFSMPMSGAAQAGGRVVNQAAGGLTVIIQKLVTNDADSIARTLRSGTFGRKLKLAMARGDI